MVLTVSLTLIVLMLNFHIESWVGDNKKGRNPGNGYGRFNLFFELVLFTWWSFVPAKRDSFFFIFTCINLVYRDKVWATVCFNGALHRFYARRSVYFSHWVQLNLWKPLNEVLSGSEGSFLKSDKLKFDDVIKVILDWAQTFKQEARFTNHGRASRVEQKLLLTLLFICRLQFLWNFTHHRDQTHLNTLVTFEYLNFEDV